MGTVFLIRDELSARLRRALLGFASGVMIAAAVWSLLLPAIDMAEAAGKPPWVPAVAGFLLGVGFLLLLDVLIPQVKPGAAGHTPVV